MISRVFGFLNIDKPSGMTSHDVVAKIRRLAKNTMGKTKVGHAGTLDPMATGVLVICLGYATRLSEYVMQSTKQYRATVHLGVETDTYDADGEVIATQDTSHITRQQLEQVITAFVGDINQVPPIYSAIKKDGKKLYELARAGKEIEVDARPVTIHALDIVDWHSPVLTLDVTCGAGTYIRSLAHDMGEKLNVGAHLSGLIRSRSGYFTVDNAVTLDTVLTTDNWQQYVISPQIALTAWNSIQLTAEEASDIQLGRSISKSDSITDEFVMAFMENGHLLAVLENRQSTWKPHKVFLPQS